MYWSPSPYRILVLWICLSLAAYAAIINTETVRAAPDVDVAVPRIPVLSV